MKPLSVFVLLCLLCSPTRAQKTWYVNAAATGSNSGANWADAFLHPQSALILAAYGDRIWVAAGTYLPTPDADRSRSFSLPPGVQLIGGFAGTEAVAQERDIQANPTVLSGDIGASGVQADNSYHVVTIHGGDSLTVLDGFVVRYGQTELAGAPFPGQYGGGLLVVADMARPLARPLIRNCLFEYNRAYAGGGIAGVSRDNAVCIPEVYDCRFSRNRGELYGGGFYKADRNLPGEPYVLRNCLFEDNYCFQYSGGVAMINPSGTTNIIGCTFIRDSSRLESGGIYLETQDYQANYLIDSCLFLKNYSMVSSAAFSHKFTGVGKDSINIVVINCVFDSNKTMGNAPAIQSFVADNGVYHKVLILESTFVNNYSFGPGGGVEVSGNGGSWFDIFVDRCLFIGNTIEGTTGGGAFYYHSYSLEGDHNRNTITNSVFMYNDGAIAALGGKPGTTDTRVVNCTFFRNGLIPFVKYWGPDINYTDFYMNMQVLNSAVWEPQVEGPQRLFYNNNPSDFSVRDYLVEHSSVQLDTCAYNGYDPCGAGMVYSAWPDFVDTAGQQLDLLQCSPLQNRGSNAVADSFGLALDFLGRPRIAGDTVDIGAFEIQSSCTSALPSGPGAGLAPQLRVFPNPQARGSQALAELLVFASGGYQLQVRDFSGRLLWQDQMDVPAWAPVQVRLPALQQPGVYSLSLSSAAGDAGRPLRWVVE
ncbi:MAG: right-handed parallel beta-helix repeat-containing protein [Saprospiraceae bacterium]|nr:right-handed parallel beta-helix repeat-containing protein [Saprospiraceae bacterium]